MQLSAFLPVSVLLGYFLFLVILGIGRKTSSSRSAEKIDRFASTFFKRSPKPTGDNFASFPLDHLQ